MSESWSFRQKKFGNGFIVREGEDVMICDVFMTNDRKFAENRVRLICAAPDLLKACKDAKEALLHAETVGIKEDVTQYAIDGMRLGVALNKLREAIAKAEGR